MGLAAEKAIARSWILFVNLNGIFPTGSFAGFSLGPAFSSITGAEYRWSSNLSLVAQFDYYSSPYRHTGMNLLDRGVTEATFGFNYRLRPHLLWQVYGVENLDFTRDSASDFTLSTVITYRFGR